MLKVFVLVLSVLVISTTNVFIVPVQGQESGGNRWPWHKITVRVENDLRHGVNLLMHCHSKQDDLGQQVLSYWQGKEWSFKVNIFLTTMYWCNFRWVSDGITKEKSFKIYEARRDYKKCAAKCLRSVRGDGVYFYDEFNDIWEKEYWW